MGNCVHRNKSLKQLLKRTALGAYRDCEGIMETPRVVHNGAVHLEIPHRNLRPSFSMEAPRSALQPETLYISNPAIQHPKPTTLGTPRPCSPDVVVSTCSGRCWTATQISLATFWLPWRFLFLRRLAFRVEFLELQSLIKG